MKIFKHWQCRTVVLGVTCGLTACSAGSRSAPAAACSPNVVERRPLRLSDGRRLRLSMTGAAWNGRAAAAVGTSARAEIPGRSVDTVQRILPVARADSVLGVVFDARSFRTLVNPLPGQRLMLARIAPASNDGWRVLLVIRNDTLTSQGFPELYTDSASIWLGDVDSAERWKPLRRIGSVSGSRAWLTAEMASELVTRGNDAAFAFAIGQPGRSAVVLLHSTGGVWAADTLRVPRMGWLVRVQPDPQEGWLVTNSDVQIIASRFSEGWSTPLPIATPNAKQTVDAGGLVAAGRSTVAWWATSESPRAPLALRASSFSLAAGTRTPVAIGSSFETFSGSAAAFLAPAGIVWLLGSQESSEADVFHQTERGVARLGRIPAARSLRAFAFATSRSEVWWIADGLRDLASVWSWVTRVSIPCAADGAR